MIPLHWQTVDDEAPDEDRRDETKDGRLRLDAKKQNNKNDNGLVTNLINVHADDGYLQ